MSVPVRAACPPPAWLTWGFRLVALAIASLHTWIAVRSQSMNEDGIGYLDLGDAIWQGRWEEAVNTTWSPLYAAIVGGVVNVVQPSPWWEFPVVQLANLALFALALVCFEFFWRELTLRYFTAAQDGSREVLIPPVAWAAIGYSLFTYVSLNLIAVWAVTPDMVVAAIVYLAAGQVLRLDRPGAGLGSAAALGLLLGLGYLAKAVMFPLGLLLIGLVALLPAAGIARMGRFAVAAGAFLMISLPWATVVSSGAGHATFSDVGRFTYLKHVNGMDWPQWERSASLLSGEPLHPARLIHDDPPVWEFATPIGGTYPLGYDPAWWTQGLVPQVSLSDVAQTLLANLVYYFDLIVRMQGGFLAVLLLLLWLSPQAGRSLVRATAPTVLVLWALAAFGLYALVHTETRYVAPFLLILWVGLLVQVRLPHRDALSRVALAGGVLLALFVWVNIGTINLAGLAGQLGLRTERITGSTERTSTRDFSGGPRAPNPEVALALLEAGVERGSPVAVVGYTYAAYWVRLARYRVVSEIRSGDVARFWALDEAGREATLASIARSGAVAVIAERPDTSGGAGFEPIGDTGFVVRRLR